MCVFLNFLRRDLLAHIKDCFQKFSFSLELHLIDVYKTLNDGSQFLDQIQDWSNRQPGHQVGFDAYLGKIDLSGFGGVS